MGFYEAVWLFWLNQEIKTTQKSSRLNQTAANLTPASEKSQIKMISKRLPSPSGNWLRLLTSSFFNVWTPDFREKLKNLHLDLLIKIFCLENLVLQFQIADFQGRCGEIWDGDWTKSPFQHGPCCWSRTYSRRFKPFLGCTSMSFCNALLWRWGSWHLAPNRCKIGLLGSLQHLQGA